MKKFKNKIMPVVLSVGIIGSSVVSTMPKASGVNVNVEYRTRRYEISENMIPPVAACCGAAAILAVSGVCIAANCIYVLLNEFQNNISRLEEKTFGKYNLKDNVYTQKQRNINWTFIACLQGLYKMRGHNISQDKIYKKLFGSSPYDSKGYCFKDMPYGPNRNFIKSANSIFPGWNFTQTIIHTNKSADDENKIHSLMKKLKRIYNCVHNFAIVDSFQGYIKKNGHDIINYSNVVDISDNYITLENPSTGRTRTESLYNFCKRYYDPTVKGILDFYNEIRIFYLTANNYSYYNRSMEEYNLYN